jgi:hypothetical protein
MAKPLIIPPAARRDRKSVEDGPRLELYVVLNIRFWEDPPRGVDERDAWGILMADMARHIANAHETEYGRDPRETLNFIREAFEREMAKPTSGHSGRFAKRAEAKE